MAESEIVRTFKLVGPVPGKVRVIFTRNMVATGRRFGYTPEEIKSTLAFCEETKPGYVTLVLAPDAPLQTIVHECGHTTFWLLSYTGVSVTCDDNEMYCYVLDYVFEKVRKLQEKAQAYAQRI